MDPCHTALTLNLKIFKWILSYLHGNLKQDIQHECVPNLGKSVKKKQNLDRRKIAHELRIY